MCSPLSNLSLCICVVTLQGWRGMRGIAADAPNISYLPCVCVCTCVFPKRIHINASLSLSLLSLTNFFSLSIYIYYIPLLLITSLLASSPKLLQCCKTTTAIHENGPMHLAYMYMYMHGDDLRLCNLSLHGQSLQPHKMEPFTLSLCIYKSSFVPFEG